MTRREVWQQVLDAEFRRWSAMSRAGLESALQEVQCYEVEFDSKRLQVEVEFLENTQEYLHVIVSVDDGSLPASLSPESLSFICRK
jgi:hypothetical protein